MLASSHFHHTKSPPQFCHTMETHKKFHTSCCSATTTSCINIRANSISKFQLLDPKTRSRRRWQHLVRRILKRAKRLVAAANSSPKQLTFRYDIASYSMNFDDGVCRRDDECTDVWHVYSTLELPNLLKTIPDFIKEIIITGDGSIGTSFDIYNLPGSAYPWYKERVGVLDDVHMIKVVNLIQGGVLDFGFISFLTRFEIIDKGANRCKVKSTVVYDIENQYLEANESLAEADSMGTVARAVEKYIEKKKAGCGSHHHKHHKCYH